MSSTMFENPLPSFQLWRSNIESDITLVDSIEDEDDVKLKHVDRRQDRMIVDVDEFMEQNTSFDTMSDSTVRLATVNSLPYCQLDDLSNARNLNETSSDLSLVNIHSSLSCGAVVDKPLVVKQPKGKSLLANIFSLRKSPTKKVSNHRVDYKRDSPPPKLKLDGFVIHCAKKEWKERQLARRPLGERVRVDPSREERESFAYFISFHPTLSCI